MPITTDPGDPGLNKPGPTGQNESYLVLSEEERAKGFVRPVRRSYVHTGRQPRFPLRDLTDEEKARFADVGYDYVKFEKYPASESPKIGRYWTQMELNSGCGTLTTMGISLAETYAREPKFYGSTFCCGCKTHLPVSEFTWDGTSETVGS